MGITGGHASGSAPRPAPGPECVLHPGFVRGPGSDLERPHGPHPCPQLQGSASGCPSRKFILLPQATWPWPAGIPKCDFRPALSHGSSAMETPPSAPLPPLAPPQGHFPCDLPVPGIRVIPTWAGAWPPLLSHPPSLLCPSHSPQKKACHWDSQLINSPAFTDKSTPESCSPALSKHSDFP